jgi:hypothetical protein
MKRTAVATKGKGAPVQEKKAVVGNKVNVGQLKTLLNNVYLGGFIEECVLVEGKNGFNYVQAVDKTNSFFLRCSAQTGFTGFKKIGIGDGDLEILIDYLSIVEEEDMEISINKNKMICEADDNWFEMNLSQPDVIVTAVPEDGLIEKFLEVTEYKIPITADVRKKFNKFIRMCGLSTASLDFIKMDVGFSSSAGPNGEYVIYIGKATCNGKGGKPFEIVFETEKLQAIFARLDFSAGNKAEANIHFNDGAPVVVKQADNVWAMSTIK